jgi:ferredoxin-type protein NapF
VEVAVPARWRVRLRRATRLAALVVAVMLLLAAPAPWPLLVPAASPLAATATILATWTCSVFMLPALAIALAACVWRRCFCQWVCPTGLCADGAAWLGRRCGRQQRRFPRLGPALAFVILFGACLGYPVLLWLDPLALLSGAGSVRLDRLLAAVSWMAFGLACVLIVSLLWPHLWCARICPLGGLQDVLDSATKRAVGPIRRRWSRRSPCAAPAAPAVQRRVFLGGAVGLAWAAWLRGLTPMQPRPLRPPGAVDEQWFTTLCVRCGNCLRACPAGIIQCDDSQHGIGGLLAPVIVFQRDYCWESCNRCTLVCPSGAISRVLLPEKPHAIIGRPRVDMDICLLSDDRDCSYCRSRCPYMAIRFEFDEQTYTLAPRVDHQRCNGCGACEVACPTQPRKAITVEIADRDPVPSPHLHEVANLRPLSPS